MVDKMKKSLGDAVLPAIIISIVLTVPELLGWKDGHLEAHDAEKLLTISFHENIDLKMANYQTSISRLLNSVAEVKLKLEEK